jgi:general L-amino acid transport system permease protein
MMTNPAMIEPSPIKKTPVEWLKENLFNTWYNSLLTLLIIAVVCWLSYGFIIWATVADRWDVITVNFPLFFVGRYPKDQYWRMWLILTIIASLSGLCWGIIGRNCVRLFTKPVLIVLGVLSAIALLTPVTLPFKLLLISMIGLVVATAYIGQILGRKKPGLGKWLSLFWFIGFLIILWLIGGNFGLVSVSTNDWGGLLLTILTAVVSIILSFPLGLILGVGRQSHLPVIKILSTFYIEIIRGLPLISVLFMGQVMIPMFLPDGMRPDRVLRAILALTLFSAAYLAENIRGGLQSLPKGQVEAAKSLGLNAPLTMGLIVLPQALKVAIPAIVGQFISLFQDTTLLAIVGLLELLGISRSILAQPQFLGNYAQVNLFNGVIFWVFCYAMSLASRQLEKKFNTTHH